MELKVVVGKTKTPSPLPSPKFQQIFANKIINFGIWERARK
jgi:hypothetical protein